MPTFLDWMVCQPKPKPTAKNDVTQFYKRTGKKR